MTSGFNQSILQCWSLIFDETSKKSVFSRTDNTGGKEASFFFFVIGVVWYEDKCAVVTGKFAEKDGNDSNDECGNDDDEKDSDNDDDFRFDSDDAVFRDFFFGAILYLPFLTFLGGVTIEVDVLGTFDGLASDGDWLIVFGGETIEVNVLGTFDGLASDGDRLIVFAMLLILCCVVLFLEI